MKTPRLAALPILAKAEAVHVLEADVHKAEVPAFIKAHGIPAQAHAVEGHGPPGERILKAAHTLGASRWQTFWRITLPSIRWAVVYGVVLTTARCLGEFGAVAVVSGNIDGKTQTATLRVEDAYQFAYGNYAPAYGISLVLAVTAVVVLVTMMILQPKGAHA